MTRRRNHVRDHLLGHLLARSAPVAVVVSCLILLAVAVG